MGFNNMIMQGIKKCIAVMYLGRIVESAKTEDLFADPKHPYTQALLREIPRLDMRGQSYNPISGEVPSPLSPPSGCHFHPRCPHAIEQCTVKRPPLTEISPGWSSACYLK